MSRAERADVGEGVTLVGRWHDMAARTGVAIFESSDQSALQRYIGQWTPFMDIDVSPVLDDEETAEIARTVMAGMDD